MVPYFSKFSLRSETELKEIFECTPIPQEFNEFIATKLLKKSDKKTLIDEIEKSIKIVETEAKLRVY